MQETINYYLEVGIMLGEQGQTQREPIALKGVPGMVEYCVTPGPTRALERFNTGSSGRFGSGNLYACCGNKFGVIDNLGNFTTIGTIDGQSGKRWMREMRNYIVVSNAPFDVINGFSVFPSSVSQIYVYSKLTGSFEGINNQNNTAFAGHNADTFFISNIDNPATYDASKFTAVNTRYNIVVAIVVSSQRVIVFGTEYIEFYLFSGASDFPLERQEGATIELGCQSAGSITSLNGIVYFLATDGQIYRINTYQLEKVSTKPIDESIKSYGVPSFAEGFAYDWSGHRFYNLIIDSPDVEGRTWVFDDTLPVELGWSRRKSENLGYWRGFMAASAYGGVYAGDLISSKIWRLDDSVYTEGEESLEAIRTGFFVHADQKSFKVSDFEIICQAGASSLDSDPGAFASYTKDGGSTFSSEIERKFSNTRLIWRNNGNCHGSIAFRTRIVARRNRDIVGATARFTAGNER